MADVLGGEVIINPGPTDPKNGVKPEHGPMEVRVSGYVPQTGGNVQHHRPQQNLSAGVKPPENLHSTAEQLTAQFLLTPINVLIQQCADFNIDCDGIPFADIPAYIAMVLVDPEIKLAKSGMVSDKPTNGAESAESETAKDGK
tara:strand:- start:3591 stop:4019 length:429 start_codon:yes stop_codon:yes gene_type:complete